MRKDARDTAKFVKAKKPKETRRKNSMTPSTKGKDSYNKSQVMNRLAQRQNPDTKEGQAKVAVAHSVHMKSSKDWNDMRKRVAKK